MTKPYRIALLLFFVSLLAQGVFAQKPVAKENLKQTQEEWLQSLPEKVRDSIVYKEWKEAQSSQDKKAAEIVQTRIDAALANPNTTYLDLSYFPNAEVDPRIVSLKKLQKVYIAKSKKLNLEKLFNLLAKLPELHYLILDEGGYSALPSNIGNLVALDSFSFRSNNIKSLPAAFTGLQKLRYLDLEHSAYLYDDDLYERLKTMHVQTLDLSACGLLELNNKIGEVKSLTKLDISVNDIKTLPESFAQLSSLEWLGLNQNLSLNGEAVAATLSHITSLKALYIDQCNLTTLPTAINTIASLKVLSARENIMTTLPATFSGLTNLEELYLGSGTNAFRVNVIQNLPLGFGNLKKLRVLDLAGNQLASLGTDFDQLTNLEWIDLSRNGLPGFPVSLTNQTKLRFINLNRNKISEVPVGLGKLTQLDSLFLDADFFNKSDKKIKVLPDDLCTLKGLKKLTLKDNVVEHLPACIGDMSSLQWLDVRGNLIETLPASFTKLSKLKTLDLKSNGLKGLPGDFANLSSLADLNVAMNVDADLTSIVAVVSKIKSLKILDISYNNLTRAQAQPLIDALPGCKIINIDYYNKAPLPTNEAPATPHENRPILDNAPKRNK